VAESRNLLLIVGAISLATVTLGLGCGSGKARVAMLQFTSVGSSRFSGETLVLRSGPKFERFVSLLPNSLPRSTEELPGTGACRDLLLNVTMSNHDSRVYGPCAYPRSVRPALRAMCRDYYADSALSSTCARL
jgi:hypothetical protein